MSGVTEEGGAAEVEQQQQQQHEHKYGPEGELTRYKSRLVAKGFQQTKGKDYDEVFAPVGKGTTLRVLLAMAALLGWKIRQMDIVTAFLNGIILEEVYMKQPEGLDDGSGREKDEILMLLVYVDDILLFSASTALLDSAEQMLEMQFKCSKMGEVVGESDRKLFHSMVGSLNYAANHTRPDIAFATSRISDLYFE
ncbi:hypothetical protein CLOP_g22561 [Closterium sp. NIES-67]|nr:hypothetical protein CLOP_g22561 [Closterium sp. NIES-67]